LLLSLLALGSVACGGGPQNTLEPAGPFAREPDELWDLVFAIAAAIFIVVEGALVYALIKFRHKPGRKAAQFHGNTKLEVLLTAIPTLILAGIAVPTVQNIFDLAKVPGNALPVRVVAHQFWWEFSYPEQGLKTANELHIPTDRPISVTLAGASTDPVTNESEVVHSFWVPRLAGTQDIVPGHTNSLLLQADEPGTYLGQCKEFCGLSHANMKFRVVAETPEDFETWLSEQQAPAAEDGLVAEGARLFQQGEFANGPPCSACHALDPSLDAAPATGPNLAHFASRDNFAADMFPRTDENLRAWLAGPPDVKPGARMPDLGLTGEQIDALVAYLQSLE
jgi:cytochrome c oxidase subunit 2